MADVQTTDINTKPTVTAIDSNDQIYISDGGTALKKISYTNLAKAIIEQYNASQLAGATKTIQTAFNELNSNTHILATTFDDLCSKILVLPSSRTVPLYIPSTVTSDLINVNMTGKGYVSKVSNVIADIVIYAGSNGELYSVRLNPTTKEVSYITSLPTRAEVNALKNTLSPTLSGCGANSAIHAVQIEKVVAVTAKIEYSGTNVTISGLPTQNGDTQNGFVIMARDQTNGSVARMWTNGSDNILKIDNLTEDHVYGLSYTYITA